MSVTDEPNVMEGLSFVTSDRGKGALYSHIKKHMVKSQSEQEKSHSWRFRPQRSETFSRVADLRHLLIDSATSRRRQRLLRKLTKNGASYRRYFPQKCIAHQICKMESDFRSRMIVRVFCWVKLYVSKKMNENYKQKCRYFTEFRLKSMFENGTFASSSH